MNFLETRTQGTLTLSVKVAPVKDIGGGSVVVVVLSVDLQRRMKHPQQ